jgi:NAD(P)-dependent dehydrogenase (short-subunit alcohol dehydrogenase family)
VTGPSSIRCARARSFIATPVDGNRLTASAALQGGTYGTARRNSAIVTGGAQGIGATYAKALAAEGARVSVCDLDLPDAVVEAIRAAGGDAIGRICDVSDAKAVAALVEATEAAFGGVQVLVNNAALFGKIPQKPFTEIDSSEWDRVMAVNTRGPFECARAVFPVMRRRRYGKIINIASGTVFKGTPMMLHYVASKGAVVAMTRAMARELGEHGICCNALAPGLTLSDTIKGRNDYGGLRTLSVESRALKREETPDDLVGALIFLASHDSDFMTGQTILVDGGSAMH